MASFKLHGGDFPRGTTLTSIGKSVSISIPWQSGDGWAGKSISLNKNNITSLETTSEESVKKIIGSAGAGLVGLVALGPLGAAVGVLAGGNRKNVTFLLIIDDGRKMLATADSKVYTKLLALTM